MTIINLTGHRSYQKDKKTGLWVSKLAFEGHDMYSSELFERLVDLFYAYYMKHTDIEIVISGMAIGVDLAGAVAALEANRKVHAYVPYKGHGNWRTFYGEVHRDVIEQAELVSYGADKFSVESLLQRNKDMVHASDYVLALHNGDKGGGTAHCIRYAESQGKKVVNLWSQWDKHKHRKS